MGKKDWLVWLITRLAPQVDSLYNDNFGDNEKETRYITYKPH
jgi:hypothetical protein